jgi:hypothetical protein
MSLHDEFLDELARVASSVRLVASLRDERLNFGSPDDLRVFIPDTHVVSRATRLKYSYGTNDGDLLADVLTRLAGLKVRGQNRTVAVYQMGDFLDLWREEPIADVRVDAASRIIADHPTLMHAFFNPALKTRFLLGNHDVDLAWWPNFVAWERRFFLPPRGSTRPSGLALHGDILDWRELMPDAPAQFFVYFCSPFVGPSDHDLRDVRTVIARQNHKLDFSQRIAGPAGHGDVVSLDGLAARHNLSGHELFNQAHALTQRANRTYGLDLRFMVIGHTHHARIAIHESDDDFFALIDCGGWLEDAFDQRGGRYPNQTLAVLSNNEARIYQIER